MAIQAPNFRATGRDPIQLAFQLRERERMNEMQDRRQRQSMFSSLTKLASQFGGPQSEVDQYLEETEPPEARMPLTTRDRGLPFGEMIR